MSEFRTNRLSIRTPKKSDLEQWHRLFSNPLIMSYVPDLMTETLEDSQEKLTSAIADGTIPNRTHYYFSVELIDSCRFIGSIGFTLTKQLNYGLADGGFFFLSEFQGEGYATEAFKAVLRFAFCETSVKVMTASCFVENRASEKVMQNCGMVKQPTRGMAASHKGILQERVTYQLLKEEWEEQQE